MNIFITGTTGFLGGELLIELSRRPEIDKIYCLIRGLSEEHAMLRVRQVFELHNDPFDEKKIIPILGNLSENTLSHKLRDNKMLNDTDVVIHAAANTSFSKVFDKIVEEVNITGLEHLIKWANELPSLKTFLYVGTASISGKENANRLVQEDESPNTKVHHVVKYTYTKMMGEIMLTNEISPEKLLIVRPSIIMGDSRNWIPRSYVILWAFATVNILRLIPAKGRSKLDIISVDYAAQAITELLFAPNRRHRVYHISSGEASATDVERIANVIAEFFPELPPVKFVDSALLKQMNLWAKKVLPKGSELYQYDKYLEYWKETFGDINRMRILLAALAPYLEFAEMGQRFDNSRLIEDTGMSLPVPAHVYIKNSARYIKNIDVFGGAAES
ncbi:MAG: NAD-dependent epimerase/dehydratase family protein [Bacteroidia bacterium]|jgi:thioester reductase-like protein|nr:NAD-dependent epimerase/dehydratase family protein [Bacteroidia bacterium]